MQFLPDYIVKLSISLAVVYLFYYLVLRKLTFYDHNRWYLVGYTMLSFVIPFINITGLLQKNNWHNNEVINWVPVINNNAVTDTPVINTIHWSIKEVVVAIIISGMLLMLGRLLLQVFSFKKMLRKAEPVSNNGVTLYQVNDNIIPFSFGNAIFINRHLHTEGELQEIIGHEFVHVKQRHSFDIIWGELLCIINWYNPFVWLIKRSIRQNLEFIADNKVLQNGINKTEYQYLLLKVIGNNQYSIATPFNFSSLKKRIAMMNKTKSAKRQLIRLLFLLPATAVLLLAFRSKWNAAGKTTADDKAVTVAGLVVDAKTLQPLANAAIYCKEKNISITTDDKGYYLLQLPVEDKPLHFTLDVTKEGYQPFHQTENWGNFSEEKTYGRFSKSIEYFGLSKDGRGGFSSLNHAENLASVSYDAVAQKLPQLFNRKSPDYDGTVILTDTTREPNSKGYFILVHGKTVVIKNKEGKEVKRVPLKEWNENAEKYEDTYGELPPPPPPPAPPAPPVAPLAPPTPELSEPLAPPAPDKLAPPPPPPPAPPAPPAPPKLPANVKRMDIRNNKATIWLKSGQQEKYDLNNEEEKEKFEKKYGQQLEYPAPRTSMTFSGDEPSIAVLSGNQVRPLTASFDEQKLGVTNLPDDKLYVLDGNVTTKQEIEKLNQKSVGIVRYLKPEAAVAKYGDKGKHGAYLVSTAVPAAGTDQVMVTASVSAAPKISDLKVYTGTIHITNADKLIVVDGNALATNNANLSGVFNVSTLNKKQAKEKYGSNGANGAIEITSLQ